MGKWIAILCTMAFAARAVESSRSSLDDAIANLASPQVTVRLSAIRDIARRQTIPAVVLDQLLDIMKADAEFFVRATTTLYVVDFALKDPKSVDLQRISEAVADVFLNDRSIEVKRSAANGFSNLATLEANVKFVFTGKPLAALRQALQSPEKKIQRWALAAMVRAELSSWSETAIIALANDEDAWVRSDALDALSVFPTRRARDVIVRHIRDDENSMVRRDATRAILNGNRRKNHCADPLFVEHLNRLLDADVRAALEERMKERDILNAVEGAVALSQISAYLDRPLAQPESDCMGDRTRVVATGKKIVDGLEHIIRSEKLNHHTILFVVEEVKRKLPASL